MDRIESAMVRAEEAQRILGSTIFSQAFDETRQALMEAWASLDKPQSDHAQDLHRMIKCLDKVKLCLETHVSTGKLARKEIEERSKLSFLRRA